MIFIRKFNEGYSHKDYESSIIFCEEYLANLLDNGFTLFHEKDRSGTGMICFRITLEGERSRKNKIDKVMSSFKWNDVKDYLIPFFEILSLNYSLDKNIVFTSVNGKLNHEDYFIDFLINDEIDNSLETYAILFKLIKKL